MAPATASSVRAGRMAVRALLKAATPTGSESTPEPTMDLTRFAVDAVRPALPSSRARMMSLHLQRGPAQCYFKGNWLKPDQPFW